MRRQAEQENLTLLINDARDKVNQGLTTADEIIRD